MASGVGGWGWKDPLLQDLFVKNIGTFFAYDFLAMSLKFYWLTFKNNFKSGDLFSAEENKNL